MVRTQNAIRAFFIISALVMIWPIKSGVELRWTPMDVLTSLSYLGILVECCLALCGKARFGRIRFILGIPSYLLCACRWVLGAFQIQSLRNGGADPSLLYLVVFFVMGAASISGALFLVVSIAKDKRVQGVVSPHFTNRGAAGVP